MSSDRDTTRIVRSWLEEGATALPDRVLDAVLDQVPATPQRRPWWPPRRFAQMNSYARIAIAAAAVVVVAAVGYSLLPRDRNVGGPPTPTPIVTATTSPTVAPITRGPLAPGTYLVSDSDLLLPYTVTLPAGWTYDIEGFIVKGGAFERAGATGVAFATWGVSHVYGDACLWQGTLREAGSRQLLYTALKEQTGFAGTKGGNEDVSLGGYPASMVEISVNADFDLGACQSSVLRLWPDPGPDESGGHRIWPGQTTKVYAVEESGKAMAVFTVSNEGSAPDDVAELQAILESVEFER